MNKLINEVKKSMAISKVAIEKDKIKRMLKLISGKEHDLKVIKEEINTLKDQLEKGDYRAVRSNDWTIEVFGCPLTYPRINRRANTTGSFYATSSTSSMLYPKYQIW